MGAGNNGKKTIFTVEGLSQTDVIDIGRSRCNSDNGNQHPGIAVDINWAVYQLMNLAAGPLAATCQLLLDWATNGAVMWPICDGDTRPISKQATNKNNAFLMFTMGGLLLQSIHYSVPNVIVRVDQRKMIWWRAFTLWLALISGVVFLGVSGRC